MTTFTGEPYEAREACPRCGTTDATIETRSGQDCVFCAACGRHLYNAPKWETKREARPVPTREAIKPSVRAQVLTRDGFRCVACNASGGDTTLHASHITSVKNGGTDDISNLLTLCDTCNLGFGSRDLPAELVVRIGK